MDNKRTLNRRYETIAWGAFFILLGLTSLFRVLPDGSGTVGIGIILLGLNLARYLSGIPTSGFTITLGVIALVLVVADILRALRMLPIDLPFFPVLLIVIGVIWLIRGVNESRTNKRMDE